VTGGPGKPLRPGTPTPTPGSAYDEAPTVTSGRGAAIYAAAGLLPGTRVGHYVLQHELGRGGMGQVFLARDTKLDRKVAIKFVAMDGAAAVERFMAEARVTARCVHPNIVVIHEISEHAGVPYTVLEYVAGDSVAVRLRQGAMPPERVVGIMTQVARAMVAAHAKGIIHRDLKPANILLGADGAVKVVDFGIAKHVAQGDLYPGDGSAGDLGARDLTSADELVGTLHYLAPEHVRREAIDARVDLWAFGVTMFQMLSGKRPLEGLPRLDVIDQLRDLDAPLPRLDTVAPATPPALVEIVHRCLEKRADRRMASATELVAALEGLPVSTTSAVSTASPPSLTPAGDVDDASAPPTRRQEVPREPRWWLGAALVAALAITVGMWIGRCGARRGERTRASATSAAAASRATALLAEIDRLEGAGQAAEAARLYDAFIHDERDATALTLAWLGHGDRQRARGQRDAALDSYAAAYARSADPVAQRRALLALSELYRERWEWDRLIAALDVHDHLVGPRATTDPRAAQLRDAARFATRSPDVLASPSASTAALARALLTGRAVPGRAAGALTLDLDGDGTHELLAVENGAIVVRSADGARDLARRPTAGLDDLRCAGRDASGEVWAVMAPSPAAHRGWHLVDVTGGTPAIALDALAPSTRGRCYWADLDGDRRGELYLVGDTILTQVARRARDTWSARVTRLGSQVGDVIGGDLDGDGTEELVVAVGEWRAYDVRVLRADAAGDLRIDDRVRLGVVTGLANLGRDATGRARVAAIKEDVYPSARELPADRPHGAAPGLYILALGPRSLEVRERVELPVPPTAIPAYHGLLAGDFDGDGTRDLVASTNTHGTRGDMLVLRGREGGGFDVNVVGGVTPLGVTTADADPADELLVRLDGEAAPWLLGAGDQPLRPIQIPRLAETKPAAVSIADPVTGAAWNRAEELARIGRVDVAADALRRIATTAPTLTVKAEALRRAAALLQARGLPCAATLEGLAALEAPSSRARLEALLAAAEERAARLEVADARRVIDEASRSAALTDEERARLVAMRSELEIAPLPLFTGEPLAGPWRVLDPSLAHVVPGSRRLTVETLVPGAVVSLPLVRSAALVTLAFDAEVTRTEWAGSVRVRLGPRDRARPGAIFVEIGGRGGGGIYQRRTLCGMTAIDAVDRSRPLVDADAVETVHVEVAARPAHGRGRCAITYGAEHLDRAFVDGDDEPAASGFDPGLDWELSIEGGADAQMTSAVLRFASITVSGFTVPSVASTEGVPAALDAAALALAAHRTGDARHALASLTHAEASSWRARRLAIVATEESGDHAAAVARLAAALTASPAARPSTIELALLVRARDGQFAPLVREALGARVAPVLHAAWATVAYHDLDEPRVRMGLIRDLGELPSATPATAAATLSLHGYLGEALLAAGRPDDARRALVDALALVPADVSTASPALRDHAARIAVLLAIDAATRNDAAAARAWGQRGAALSDVPEHVADRLLQHPATAALAADPAWSRIVALGRKLSTP